MSSVSFFCSDSFDSVFTLMFPSMIIIFAIIVLTVIIKAVINVRSPILTVSASVISKREHTSSSRQFVAGDITGAHGYHDTFSTSYTAVFETDSGEMLKLDVTGEEYGRLLEGERGLLSFKGSRFLDFEKK